MRLQVLIRRQGHDETEPGTLRAWVLQNGVQSKVNLLSGRQVSAVWRAQQYIETQLRLKYGEVEIDWVGLAEQVHGGAAC